MLRKLKYDLVLLPWKMMFLSRTELHLAGIIVSAVITALATGHSINWSSYSIVQSPILSNNFTPRHDCKSWKTTLRHKTTLITKTACTRKYFLLILVSSAPANLERRSFIRQTWGADNNKATQWKTYFLLGQTRNRTQSDLLKREDSIYGDMIRADYYEHYWNQSLKIQMAFEWAARYCNFSYLLKADDDVLVNTKDLVTILRRRSTPKQGLFMGKLHHNVKAARDGKFKISYEEYNRTYYTDFCSGAGIVMSWDVVHCLVPLFDVIKPFRMDDVYIGMLANRSGVTPVGHDGFIIPFSYDVDDCNYVANTLVLHRAIGQCLLKLFRLHSEDFVYGTKLGSYF
ncbi:beta-1,3-galactosyltransferase 5-like [Orbicella faveolata]|uniref:beta-1,3-galactosyltransferase 5-like n=1 Tax=Orbicella faveolata TaxID=48498 RepID=UPI0009E1A2C0|nr:beta-1,3-galactosyltransferase 5-like [Orbicella faveolata]